jgi:hypothetical protein
MHAWAIDEREYARHETRRGRRHAFERIDPMRAALVVVDMVPFFVNENPYARGIVPNINASLAPCGPPVGSWRGCSRRPIHRPRFGSSSSVPR